MFDYTVCKDNSPKEFKKTCALIEEHFPTAYKRTLAVDVDGSTIQLYRVDRDEILVYDDYDVGAVYVKSDINLNSLFN